MASFEKHLNVAVVATGCLIVPLHSMSLLNIHQSLIVLGLGLLGGILPDIDSDNSKPTQAMFKILSIFVPLVMILSISMNLPILQTLILWIASSIALHLTLFKVFIVLTTHRGIFHSIPMGVLFGEITILLFYYIFETGIEFSIISGFFISFGFMVHLVLDEIYSINALGMRMKKSFGSAFKLYDKNNKVGTIIVYCLVIIIFLMIPLESDIYNEIFQTFKKVKII